ncbi:MAG: type II secretion system protein GspD, partial [Gammaproteobacteria bacterium]
IRTILESNDMNKITANGLAQASVAVIPNPETGLLTVKATARQHEQIQRYIDDLLENANRQVLIQATIVEVDLKEEYQAGIDWSYLNKAAGLSLVSATLPGAAVPTALSLFQFLFKTPGRSADDVLKITINLLDEFGEARVLSSPQMMVLNNQTAVLKVVDNEVFFTIEANTTQNQTNSLTSVETAVHTVPVGIVMPITPQISATGSVILNVRPTISRVVNRVEDPNPTLRFAPDGTPLDHPVTSVIPEIRVREMESVLRMQHGQIAVLGGLMQNTDEGNNSSIPGLSTLPLLGEAFRSRSRVYSKTELVVFITPTVVRNPDIHEDLRLYRTFLENTAIDPP